MRILFLSSYFYPEQAASHYLGDNRYQAFASNGFEMINYVPMPCRGISDEIRQKYREKKIEKFYDDKLIVHRFSMFKEPKNPIGRALRYMLVCMKQLHYGLTTKDVDVLFLSSTPPIIGLVGSLIKKWRKIPFIYNLQDIFPDSLVGTGLTKKGSVLWKIGRKIEDFTYRNADKIVVISQDFKQNIMEKGVPEEKIEIIYNWVDQHSVVGINREDNKLLNKYNLPKDKFYVTYSGNIGLTQNMDMLLDVVEELQDYTNIHFVLIGQGAYKAEVESIIKEKQLTNITVLPLQPYEDISDVFSLGNVGLVISKPGVGTNSVPSKTWSILSASRPVLANFDPNELQTIIDNNKCGIFTKAGDTKTFKEAILYLANHPEECEIYGKNGRSFIEKNLTKEIGTAKFVNLLKSFE